MKKNIWLWPLQPNPLKNFCHSTFLFKIKKFAHKSGDACCEQLFIAGAFTNGQQEYHGILINGLYVTQLYDPFNTPHARGNLQLGLQTGNAAYQGAAVINGQLAYFASDGHGPGTFW